MRVLILGSGGREHALAWKLSQSPLLAALFVAPGNPGTLEVAENLPIQDMANGTVVSLVKKHDIDLLVIGPEVPLAAGVVDAVRADAPQCRVFGPTRAAARLEWSKEFGKEFMRRHGIPTAQYSRFSGLAEAERVLPDMKPPFVMKTDGLASGKGVVVCHTDTDVRSACRVLPPEQPLIVEEYLSGRELSLHFITDGERYHLLELAEDHKQLLDGDGGPNTGGMGTVSPLAWVDSSLLRQAKDIAERTVAGLKADSLPYRGALFVGLMNTPQGLKVLEYNCRFGDPETQVMLARMEGDLLPYLWGAAEGILPDPAPTATAQTAVCVVVCGSQYPALPSRGEEITGLSGARDRGNIIFHAGTAQREDMLVSAGGRILNIVGLGGDLEEARSKAYAGVAEISLAGMQYRRDIGVRKGV